MYDLPEEVSFLPKPVENGKGDFVSFIRLPSSENEEPKTFHSRACYREVVRTMKGIRCIPNKTKKFKGKEPLEKYFRRYFSLHEELGLLHSSIEVEVEELSITVPQGTEYFYKYIALTLYRIFDSAPAACVIFTELVDKHPDAHPLQCFCYIHQWVTENNNHHFIPVTSREQYKSLLPFILFYQRLEDEDTRKKCSDHMISHFNSLIHEMCKDDEPPEDDTTSHYYAPPKTGARVKTPEDVMSPELAKYFLQTKNEFDYTEYKKTIESLNKE